MNSFHSFRFTKSLLGLAFAGALVLTAQAQTPKKVLVVTTTTGFRHSSIETAEMVIAQLAEKSGAFTVDYARVTPPPRGPRRPKAPKDPGDPEKFKAAQEQYQADLAKFEKEEEAIKEAQRTYSARQKQVLAEKMSPQALKNYDAVIFANTTGDLPLPDNQAFIDWVSAGHGFVATHSGSDTFHGFRPYIEMLGGEFQTHGAQEIVECLNHDTKHPATRHFGSAFDIGGRKEEMYIIKSYDRTTVHELLVMDKHPNTKEAGNYPVSWCKAFGKGKVFYTSLGHNEYVWEMPDYQTHLLGGIKWALGLEPGDATPQAK